MTTLDETIKYLLPYAMKLKAEMIDNRVWATYGKCPMPGCAGRVHASLAGPKQHLRVSCDTCTARLME